MRRDKAVLDDKAFSVGGLVVRRVWVEIYSPNPTQAQACRATFPTITASSVGCLRGKDPADLALSGVGRIAVVRLYRYVDDREALELSRQRGRQRVGGSSIVR